MFSNTLKTESLPHEPSGELAMPSCQALMEAVQGAGHGGRYGLLIPNGSRVKRKLFADDEVPHGAGGGAGDACDCTGSGSTTTTTSTTTPMPRTTHMTPPRPSYAQSKVQPRLPAPPPPPTAGVGKPQPLYEYPKRIVLGNGISQIAIRKKYNDSPTGLNNEVFLLNGNWDTSHTIPNIVAEMHNVNLAELQCTWGGDEPLTTAPGNDSRDSLGSVASKDSMDLGRACGDGAGGCGSGGAGDSGNASQDFITDDNFSWLVNFKLDDLIHAYTPTSNMTDYMSDRTSTQTSAVNSMIPSVRSITMQGPKYSQVYIAETIPKQYLAQHQVKNVNGLQVMEKPGVGGGGSQGRLGGGSAPPVGMKNVRVGNGVGQGNHVNRYSGPRKPPFTYTELIEHALQEKGELTVSGIYQWISDHFPFYKANDDRWKNSVRHNLSINPHFRKGSKAVHGAGHLWTIAKRDDRKMSSWMLKKQRMQQFIEKYDEQEKAMEDELQAATASIMPDLDPSFMHGDISTIQNDRQRIVQNGVRTIDRTSEDLLGGVKYEVEYLIPVEESMDFMCPVTKEQVAEECGLQSGNDRPERTNDLSGGDYLITDLNPQTLGLNLSEAEIITPEQLFGDDLNFQCYELQV